MAIVSASSKIPAQIGAFGRAKESTFNPGQMIQSIKAISNDGGTVHWFTLPAEQAKQFEMGQPLNLIPTTRKGRDTFDIEPLDLPPQPQIPQRPLGFRAAPSPAYSPAPAPQPMQQQQQGLHKVDNQFDKVAIASWITGQAKLLEYCRGEVAKVNPDLGPGELQAAAATLYISASRKFGLER